MTRVDEVGLRVDEVGLRVDEVSTNPTAPRKVTTSAFTYFSCSESASLAGCEDIEQVTDG